MQCLTSIGLDKSLSTSRTDRTQVRCNHWRISSQGEEGAQVGHSRKELRDVKHPFDVNLHIIEVSGDVCQSVTFTQRPVLRKLSSAVKGVCS